MGEACGHVDAVNSKRKMFCLQYWLFILWFPLDFVVPGVGVKYCLIRQHVYFAESLRVFKLTFVIVFADGWTTFCCGPSPSRRGCSWQFVVNATPHAFGCLLCTPLAVLRGLDLYRSKLDVRTQPVAAELQAILRGHLGGSADSGGLSVFGTSPPPRDCQNALVR